MTSSAPAGRGDALPYRPELDGLRALSMLAVVAYHAQIHGAGLAGGFIGVDVFFVLSGALITQLLLSEEARSGTVSLPRFYVRRIRRLYPAMLAMIVATTLAAIVLYPRELLGETVHDAGFCALYLGDLLALEKRVRFFGHAWTLTVEEVFYLVWPLAFLALGRAGKRARILFLALVVAACEARRIDLWFDDTATPQRIWVGLDTRAGLLALGCLLAFAVRGGAVARAKPWLMRLAPLAAIALLTIAVCADRRTELYVTWGYPATALLATVVVARLFAAPSRALAAPPLVWLGKLSYSLYLWHVPALTFGEHLGWPLPLILAITLAVSCASYYGLESRFRARSTLPASSASA